MVALLKSTLYGLAVVLLRITAFICNTVCHPVVVDYLAKKGHMLASIGIHLLLFIIVFYEVPAYMSFRVADNIEDQVLVVDMVDVASITNINLGGVEQKDSNDSKAASSTPKYDDPEKVPDNVPPKVSSDDLTEPEVIDGTKDDVQQVKKAPIKQSNNEKAGKAKAEEQDKLRSVLKSIKRKGAKEAVVKGDKRPDSVQGKGKTKTPFNKSKPITLGAIDSIRSKFIACWKVPYGAKDAETIKVSVNVKLDIDGRVISTRIRNMRRYRSDPFYRAMADSAVRAVLKCSPIDYLPRDRYHVWSEIELNFDPSGMFR